MSLEPRSATATSSVLGPMPSGTAEPSVTSTSRGPGPASEPRDAARGNELATRLYRAMIEHSKSNVFLSPPSLRLALGMAYVGAEGATATEMAQALGFEPDRAAVAAQAKHEIEGWSKLGGVDLELHLVNRLWTDTATVFAPPFVELTREGWSASLGSVDFRKAPEPARKNINAWVGEQTKGRVAELLPAGSVSSDTRLLITNAVYFDAKWASPFEARKTSPGPFFVSGGAKARDVPVMHQRHAFGYAEADGAKLVLLPYGSSPLGLVVVLPDARDGLSALESQLTAERLAAWGGALAARPRFVDLGLPKFETSFTGRMRPVLEALGMKRVFTGAAELGGMSPGSELKITDVIHQSFVRVDERGTEAAAATGIPVGLKSMPPPAIPVMVDHPFLFYLWDASAGRVLFIGRVVDPTAR